MSAQCTVRTADCFSTWRRRSRCTRAIARQLRRRFSLARSVAVAHAAITAVACTHTSRPSHSHTQLALRLGAVTRLDQPPTARQHARSHPELPSPATWTPHLLPLYATLSYCTPTLSQSCECSPALCPRPLPQRRQRALPNPSHVSPHLPPCCAPLTYPTLAALCVVIRAPACHRVVRAAIRRSARASCLRS